MNGAWSYLVYSRRAEARASGFMIRLQLQSTFHLLTADLKRLEWNLARGKDDAVASEVGERMQQQG